MSKKNSFIGTLAILSIFAINFGVGAISPALSKIAAAFPGVSLTTIYLMSTLPSLFVIPSMLITGALAGNKVKYKTLCSIGVLLFVIAGISPAFTNNFTVILIERALFGIGLGLVSPLGNALLKSLRRLKHQVLFIRSSIRCFIPAYASESCWL